jgi:hypothetical protein
MGLILIVIGAVAGWKSGSFNPSAYAILGGGAVLAAGVLLLLETRGSIAFLPDLLSIFVGWVVAFLYLAVPYTLLAWLKAKRVENRGE